MSLRRRAPVHQRQRHACDSGRSRHENGKRNLRPLALGFQLPTIFLSAHACPPTPLPDRVRRALGGQVKMRMAALTAGDLPGLYKKKNRGGGGDEGDGVDDPTADGGPRAPARRRPPARRAPPATVGTPTVDASSSWAGRASGGPTVDAARALGRGVCVGGSAANRRARRGKRWWAGCFQQARCVHLTTFPTGPDL